MADDKFLTSLRHCHATSPFCKWEIKLWVVVKFKVNVYEVQCPVAGRCQETGSSCPGGSHGCSEAGGGGVSHSLSKQPLKDDRKILSPFPQKTQELRHSSRNSPLFLQNHSFLLHWNISIITGNMLLCIHPWYFLSTLFSSLLSDPLLCSPLQ